MKIRPLHRFDISPQEAGHKISLNQSIEIILNTVSGAPRAEPVASRPS